MLISLCQLCETLVILLAKYFMAYFIISYVTGFQMSFAKHVNIMSIVSFHSLTIALQINDAPQVRSIFTLIREFTKQPLASGVFLTLRSLSYFLFLTFFLPALGYSTIIWLCLLDSLSDAYLRVSDNYPPALSILHSSLILSSILSYLRNMFPSSLLFYFFTLLVTA